MVAVFITAVLLGFAYNSASPLGVRSASTEKPAGTGAAAARVTGSSITRTGYFNETVSMLLETAPSIRSQGQNYQNQTTAIGLAPANPVPNTAGQVLPTVTWNEVKALLKNGKTLLIDARTANYYQAEHIPGAISLPANSPAPEMAAFASKYAKDMPIVVYCGSMSCPMAHNLAGVLASQYGYFNLKVMPGGFAEYRLAESQPGSGGAR